MNKPVLHQVTIGATIGDAISAHVFLLRRWLRELGFVSDIYAEHIHPDLKKEVFPIESYQPSSADAQVILHHSIGSAVVDRLLTLPGRFILIYHNITPPQFFNGVDQELVRQMEEGREQLLALQPRTSLALAVSPYNEVELQALGFSSTQVAPLVLDESQYDFPSNPALQAQFEGDGPLLLFVGRIVPNKRPEDLIKLLYYYRRIEPDAKLILVGGTWLPTYDHWLKDLAKDLGLEDALILTGHIPQQDMVTLYRLADLYVSMSEHEGFGKPLIESMYLGLPILAYASSGVPGTMGKAGVLFHEKNYEVLAELVDILVRDAELRQKIIVGQRNEVARFLEPQVHQRFTAAIKAVQPLSSAG